MRWALRLAGDDALGALSVLCVVRDAEGRWLAGPARGVGGDVGRRAGRSAPAARSRSARTRRTRSRASSRRSGRSCPSGSPSRRSSACPNRHGDAGRPGLARAAAPRSRATTSTTRTPGGRPTRALARRGPPATLRRMATPARDAGVSFRTLKYLSFTHSAIYLALLTVWIVPGLTRAELVFGWATASAGSSCRCSASTPCGAA